MEHVKRERRQTGSTVVITGVIDASFGFPEGVRLGLTQQDGVVAGRAVDHQHIDRVVDCDGVRW